jgi:hypothetical protein
MVMSSLLPHYVNRFKSKGLISITVNLFKILPEGTGDILMLRSYDSDNARKSSIDK